jgi:nucleoside-diphosphate-sugar epimerase
MKKYLVLGSSGFIGKHLCNYLRSKDFIVFEFDIANSKEEDLRKENNLKLRELINSCDFVFFLAFDIGGSKFLQNCNLDQSFLINNIKIISNTFEVLSDFDKKFIFVSSYLTKNIEHSYGLLKSIGERFTYSLNGLVVRLYNIYGNEKISIRSHVIPDLIQQAKRNNIINLNTTGEEKRQFLYIEDCCEGLFLASKNFDDIINDCNNIDLTSFEWISIKEVANIVSETLNCPLVISSDLAMNDMEYIPNSYFLKYWKPKISLKSGISNILREVNY